MLLWHSDIRRVTTRLAKKKKKLTQKQKCKIISGHLLIIKRGEALEKRKGKLLCIEDLIIKILCNFSNDDRAKGPNFKGKNLRLTKELMMLPKGGLKNANSKQSPLFITSKRFAPLLKTSLLQQLI